MTYAAAATAGVGVLSYLGGQQQAGAQSAANRQNVALTREQLAEQQRQFDISQQEGERRYGMEFGREAERFGQQYGAGGLSQSMRDYGAQQLGGYQQAGAQATGQQAALMGLQGPEAAQAAMAGFQASPGQEFMRRRAEKTALRNQAAIGGLGGGNVRAELAEMGAGFAAQDYGNYMNRLQALGGQGLAAGQAMAAKDQGVLPGVAAAGGSAPNASMAGPQGGGAPPGGFGVGTTKAIQEAMRKRQAEKEAANAPPTAAPEQTRAQRQLAASRRMGAGDR